MESSTNYSNDKLNESMKSAIMEYLANNYFTLYDKIIKDNNDYIAVKISGLDDLTMKLHERVSKLEHMQKTQSDYCFDLGKRLSELEKLVHDLGESNADAIDSIDEMENEQNNLATRIDDLESQYHDLEHTNNTIKDDLDINGPPIEIANRIDELAEYVKATSDDLKDLENSLKEEPTKSFDDMEKSIDSVCNSIVNLERNIMGDHDFRLNSMGKVIKRLGTDIQDIKAAIKPPDTSESSKTPDNKSSDQDSMKEENNKLRYFIKTFREHMEKDPRNWFVKFPEVPDNNESSDLESLKNENSNLRAIIKNLKERMDGARPSYSVYYDDIDF